MGPVMVDAHLDLAYNARILGRDLPLTEWTLEETPEGLWLTFFLPKGSYATSLLREVMKVEVDAPEEEEALGEG